MPTISSADIVKLLSGGASNAVPALSLGGVQSSVAATGSTIYASMSVTELATGSTKYRGFYVKNTHATTTVDNIVAWLNSNTPSALTDVSLGLGTSAVNGTEPTIANETTAPASVTFVAAANKAGGLAIGSLAPGQSRFIWMRRIGSAGSVTVAVADPFTVRVEGEYA